MKEVQEPKQEKEYKITKFGAVIDPNSYAEHLQPISQRQLDVLHSATQEIRDTSRTTANRTRENFINKITNFGKYRNLPPIQRMSNPQKLEQMRRKMEQNQSSKTDNGIG